MVRDAEISRNQLGMLQFMHELEEKNDLQPPACSAIGDSCSVRSATLNHGAEHAANTCVVDALDESQCTLGVDRSRKNQEPKEESSTTRCVSGRGFG